MKRLILLLFVLLALGIDLMWAGTDAALRRQTLVMNVERDLRENILPFWADHAVDPRGGFYGEIDATGRSNPKADKGSILTARIAWTFSRAYALYGEARYKELADRAAAYYLRYMLCPEGGVYWSVTAAGKPADRTVQTYAVCYGIYGLMAHYEATGDTASLGAAKRLYRFIEQELHDPAGGYYERLGSTAKMHNPHIHVMESYTALYRLCPSAELANNLREAMALVAEEKYAEGAVDFGHRMEASWMLCDAADALDDPVLKANMAAKAISTVRTKQPNRGYEREWWPWCETLMACMNAWQLGGEEQDLTAAEQAWQTITEHFIDPVHGGWYKSLGKDWKPNGNPKASVWYCPYHNSRLGFELVRRFGNGYMLRGGEYYNREGVDVMAFSDFYPEGHQGGISLIMNGKRVATNGDIRFEPTPGQWQPVPKKQSRKVTAEAITTRLCYPDSSRHLTGFNPMIYPDVQLHYSVRLEPKGDALLISVDLDEPIPADMVGRAGFNMELFPGELMGRPYLMDDEAGIYPQQPNSPVLEQASYLDFSRGNYKPDGAPEADVDHLMAEGYNPFAADRWIATPYAVGRTFTSRPDDPMSRFTVRTLTSDLKLYDGRMNHNNGWFVLRSEIPAGVTKGAVQWLLEPNVEEGWRYDPVVQVSQVGYMCDAKKVAVIERDMRDVNLAEAELVRLTASGEEMVKRLPTTDWQGSFLRYRYAWADFSDVKQPGLYYITYQGSRSTIFHIGDDVYDRGVWQPVVEYFLPVQMCHMRVSEKYKVWHDSCHMDDAQMARPGNHIDGYDQNADNHTHYHPGDLVAGLNVGGWHDAGDFDLRVESQAGECYILALAYEQFHPEIDATTIDQARHIVEIHQPDGQNDVLQQIEHGALTVVAGYKALGRLYRGIICNNLRQYVLLGDAAAMTDGKAGNADDRWVYTEVNPTRELTTAANLAATARVLRGFNDELADDCLGIARALYDSVPTANARAVQCKLQAAAELYITTGERVYLDYIVAHPEAIIASEKSIFNDELAFSTTNLAALSRVEPLVRADKSKAVMRWRESYRKALEQYSRQLARTVEETPYGVPYRPSIWGAGWDIQRFGMENYFLAKQYPELFPADPIHNALHFILGCHPGTNRRSFAGGVGAESTTVGYGLNRAEWSYIPGGVVSGTALIRPDFPELLVFPYLWQQVEYVLGGGSSNYMFLVLAAQVLK